MCRRTRGSFARLIMSILSTSLNLLNSMFISRPPARRMATGNGKPMAGGRSSRSGQRSSLFPATSTVLLHQDAPPDAKSFERSSRLHAARLRAPCLSTRRRGPGEPLSLPLLARSQAGLWRDPARVPDPAAIRAGEDAFGERESQRYGSVLRVGLSPSEYRRHARSSLFVPDTLRPLFIPSCYLAMLYGPMDNRNIREAGKAPPIVSSQ